MSEHVLRDRNGRRLGTIETRADGVQIGRDAAGGRRGEYDPKQDLTRDRNGSRVGTGNLLAALIAGI